MILGIDRSPLRLIPSTSQLFGITGLFVFALVAIVWVTLEKTNAFGKENPVAEQAIQPARINLVSVRPLRDGAVWVPRDFALRAFWAEWCDRPDTLDCDVEEEDYLAALESPEFKAEFIVARQREIQDLGVPQLRDMDLAGGRSFRAVLPGLVLNGGTLTDADLAAAVLDGAQLLDLDISRASFSGAQMNGVKLTTNHASGAEFRNADLIGAELFLSGAGPVDLRGTDLRDATLYDTGEPTPISADFSPTYERVTRLDRLELGGARIWWSLFDFSIEPVTLNGLNLIGVVPKNYGFDTSPASFVGTAFRSVDFSKLPDDYRVIELPDGDATFLPPPSDDDHVAELWAAVLEGSFGDATVTLPPGVPLPCYWSRDRLTEAEFYGSWRSVIEVTGGTWPPVTTLEETQYGDGDLAGKTYAETPSRPDLIDADCGK